MPEYYIIDMQMKLDLKLLKSESYNLARVMYNVNINIYKTIWPI